MADRIWVRETHEQDGWKFGYYANRPQDDSFIEYVPVSALAYSQREAFEQAAQIAESCTQNNAARDEPFRIAQTVRAHAESSTPNTLFEAEREFLEASVAVWQEIDRLSALPEGYQGSPSSTDPRKRELAAWERYRAARDAALSATAKEGGDDR